MTGNEPLRVRYTGTANQRVLTRRDLAGKAAGNLARALVFEPGDEVLWPEWVEVAGSEERGREVLAAQRHEFELLGEKPEDFDVDRAEEFNVGGTPE